MLSQFPVDVNLLATDLDRGKAFHGEQLGLTIQMENADGVTFACGGDSRLVKEIAAAVAFIATDDARWMTGQNIRVNGGTV